MPAKPFAPEDDLLLVHAVLDSMGRVAEAGERTASDVADLRKELAAHGTREEAALSGVERFLAGLADAQAKKIGEAVGQVETAGTDAERARLQADKAASDARAKYLKLLNHPAVTGFVGGLLVLLITQLAPRCGVALIPAAP